MGTTKPRKKAVGCFLEHGGRFLILQRADNMRQGGKWGLPAGGVKDGETETDAISREIYEEIGFKIPKDRLVLLKSKLFDFEDRVTEYSVYQIKLDFECDIHLNKHEHQNYSWVTGKKCYERQDLIEGFREILVDTGFAN